MKKNLLSILILALLVVNIVLTAIMMISVTSTNNKTAALVDTIATVMNLELTGGAAGEEEEPISLLDTAIVPIEGAFTIPLALETVTNADGSTSTGKQTYMMCSVSLSLNTKHEDYATYSETLSSYEPYIKQAIEGVIMSHTQTYCSSNRDELKAEILKAIQEVFNSTFIYDISISDVKFG